MARQLLDTDVPEILRLHHDNFEAADIALTLGLSEDDVNRVISESEAAKSRSDPSDDRSVPPRRSRRALWFLLFGLLFLAAALLGWWLLSGPSNPPAHIYVERYELTVLDFMDRKPVANVDLYNNGGSLLAKIGRDGLLVLRNIDIVPHYQLVHPDYKIWTGSLPKNGTIYLSRLMATVSIHADQPYTATFIADRFKHVVTAERDQDKQVQIPVNSWTVIEFRIGPPSAWPRRQVMLNSSEDELDITIKRGEKGPSADWQVNH